MTSKKLTERSIQKLECRPMPSVMVALSNIGGALCSTTQFRSRPLLDCRAVTLPIGERKTWRTQSREQQTPKMYIQSTSAGKGQTLCKVWLASTEQLRCSNEANMRKPLKLAGVPQINETISTASRLKLTILWGHVEEILLLNKFFSDCRKSLSCEDIVRNSCAMVPRRRFLAIFCYLTNITTRQFWVHQEWIHGYIYC